MRTFTTLMLTVAFAVPALAQPPGGRGMGMGMGGAMLLGNKSVQEELKLTEEQLTKVKDYGEKMRANRPMFDPQDREKMQEAFKKMREEGDKFVKETLTADQAKRFKEIELQQGGILAAANNEETAKALKITDDQKEKLKEIGQTLFKDRQELRQGGGDPAENRKKGQALQKEAAAKAMETLTSDQKKSWEEMTGKPFEIKMEPGQGGGAGKGKRGGDKKPNPDKNDK